MKKRDFLCTYLIALFVFGIVFPHASAQEAVVYIDPVSYTVPQVGVIFTMNVSIANVTNLFAYQFILWYNTTLLDGVRVELPPNHFLTPSESNKIFVMDEVVDDYNATHGLVWVIATLINPESPKNGSGILATITFNATAPDGPSPLKLYYPGYVYPVKLSDRDANPIPCIAIDGTVEVIPEFPAFLLIPLIVAMTFVVLVLKMKQRIGQKNVNLKACSGEQLRFHRRSSSASLPPPSQPI